ncbi:DNA/RNA nuclease SfsA [Zavarzinia sp.]|uniref:DNA/RNA nuclease SfsA n=1 Tax=Zavarzinia sp. TaxID=2027920 RepID=UPI003BB4B6EF
MNFAAPLVPGRLVRRYKRFLADVIIDGESEPITAHCANPGSMLGLAVPGARVFLEASDDPKRKLRWSWRLVEVEGTLVGIDTGQANAIVGEALERGRIPELAGFATIRREVAYGSASRVDFLLEGPGLCFLEVKSVTLSRRPGLAEFPDSVTARGTKHLRDLAAEVARGHRAALLYLVQRGDAAGFAPAADIDPTYVEAFQKARAQGLEALCYACTLTPAGITLDRPVPFVGATTP